MDDSSLIPRPRYGSVADGLHHRMKYLDDLKERAAAGDINAKNSIPAMEQSIEELKNKTNLYKADLPDEMIDKMIDYDVKYNQQPESVKTALLAMFPSRIQKTIDYYGTDALPMSQLFHHLGNDAVLAENLRKNGIPGIKYYDQGSRQGEKKTRNFVVFPGEEKKVKILERK